MIKFRILENRIYRKWIQNKEEVIRIRIHKFFNEHEFKDEAQFSNNTIVIIAFLFK
jgi:hypothetical protein